MIKFVFGFDEGEKGEVGLIAGDDDVVQRLAVVTKSDQIDHNGEG